MELYNKYETAREGIELSTPELLLVLEKWYVNVVKKALIKRAVAVAMGQPKVATQALAMDCEMEETGNRSLAGRVTIVDEYETVWYDSYIKHTIPITDYRSWVSGLTPRLLAGGKPFDEVKRDVLVMLRQRVLVGHDLEKDLKALELSHLDWFKRDTSTYPWFQTKRGRPSLRYLALKHLGMSIQDGAHDSVEDAIATMRLYRKHKTKWENFFHDGEKSSDIEYISDSQRYGLARYSENNSNMRRPALDRVEYSSVRYSVPASDSMTVCSCLTLLIKLVAGFVFLLFCLALCLKPK